MGTTRARRRTGIFRQLRLSRWRRAAVCWDLRGVVFPITFRPLDYSYAKTPETPTRHQRVLLSGPMLAVTGRAELPLPLGIGEKNPVAVRRRRTGVKSVGAARAASLSRSKLK